MIIGRLLIVRCLLGVLTVWAVSVIIFAATNLLPGDVASTVLGQMATPETLQQMRQTLGLDQPAVARYLVWLTHFASGDLGSSLVNHIPLGPVVAMRLRNTLLLAGVTAVISMPASILLGALAATYRDRALDRILSTIGVVCISTPEFFVSYLLIVIFARHFGLFSSIAEVPPNAGLTEIVQSLALPVITLALVVTGYMARTTRAAIVAVLNQPYIEMAQIKGVPRWRIVLVHALPNAIGPIVNVGAFSLGYLIVGVVIVEMVFVYPGIGQLMVDAVSTRDIPAVQACALIFGIAYVGLNVVADVIALLSNPRLRLPR